MKTTTIRKAVLICSLLLGFVAVSNAQVVLYYWDFNNTPGNIGADSLATAFSYANTLKVDSLNGTFPLWASYYRPGLGPNKARILYTHPKGNGILVNETTTGQEGGTPTPCDDSVLVGATYFHGIKYNGVLYPECPWVNDLKLLGNDTGNGKPVPYLGSTAADEDKEEAGNLFIKANNPAVGTYMIFYMPTTGLKRSV